MRRCGGASCSSPSSRLAVASAGQASRPTTRRWTGTSRRSRRASAARCSRCTSTTTRRWRPAPCSSSSIRATTRSRSTAPRAELADARGQCRRRDERRADHRSRRRRRHVRSATGGLAEAQAGVVGRRAPDRSGAAQLVAAQARQREREATATKTARDVERLKGLVAKEEISAAAVRCRGCRRRGGTRRRRRGASRKSPRPRPRSRSPSSAPQARGRRGRRRRRCRHRADRRRSSCRSRGRAPPSAEARVQQAAAALAQAELNLERTTHQGADRPASSAARRSRVGQVVQPGQPLMALVSLTTCGSRPTSRRRSWRHARRPARRRSTSTRSAVEFNGHVDSIAAGDRRAVQPAAAGERDRQLRQGRAARAGEDRASSRARIPSTGCGRGCRSCPRS